MKGYWFQAEKTRDNSQVLKSLNFWINRGWELSGKRPSLLMRLKRAISRRGEKPSSLTLKRFYELCSLCRIDFRAIPSNWVTLGSELILNLVPEGLFRPRTHQARRVSHLLFSICSVRIITHVSNLSEGIWKWKSLPSNFSCSWFTSSVSRSANQVRNSSNTSKHVFSQCGCNCNSKILRLEGFVYVHTYSPKA